MNPEEIRKAMELLPREIRADRPLLAQFEEAAQQDETGLILKWLEAEVYTNLELMRELDPLSVMKAQARLREKRAAASAKQSPPEPTPEVKLPRSPPPRT